MDWALPPIPPRWLPIAWESSAQIWTVSVDGAASSAARITNGAADGKLGLASLADGHVIYVASDGGEHHFWTVNHDGSDAKPLTAEAYLDREIASTPDGRQLLFASNRAGGSQIFRSEANGSRPQ